MIPKKYKRLIYRQKKILTATHRLNSSKYCEKTFQIKLRKVFEKK